MLKEEWSSKLYLEIESRLYTQATSDIISHDGEDSIGRNDRHNYYREIVHGTAFLIILAGEHGVEEAGQDDGNEILADGADQIEDILDVVHEHRNDWNHQMDAKGGDVEKQVLPLLPFKLALPSQLLILLLLRYHTVLIHPSIHLLPPTLLCYQVHNSNEVIPATKEHQRVGTCYRHEEAYVNDQK